MGTVPRKHFEGPYAVLHIRGAATASDPSWIRHYSQAACAHIGKSLEATARMAWQPFCANERSNILSFSFASVERHCSWRSRNPRSTTSRPVRPRSDRRHLVDLLGTFEARAHRGRPGSNAQKCAVRWAFARERTTGIEPASSAWKAEVLAVELHPRLADNHTVGRGRRVRSTPRNVSQSASQAVVRSGLNRRSICSSAQCPLAWCPHVVTPIRDDVVA